MSLRINFALEDLGGTGNSQFAHLLAQLFLDRVHFTRGFFARSGDDAIAFTLGRRLGSFDDLRCLLVSGSENLLSLRAKKPRVK